MEDPFATKGLEAVLKAVKEDKAVPHLDEVTNTSLLLPYPGASWEGVESTFIP